MAVPRVYDDFGHDDTRLDPRALLGHVLSAAPVAPVARAAPVAPADAFPSPLGLGAPAGNHPSPPIHAALPAAMSRPAPVPVPAGAPALRADAMRAASPTYVEAPPAGSNTTVVLLGVLAGVVCVGVFMGAYLTFF